MRPFNVLFLCTGNSARSILAEGYLNAKGHGRFVAYSAGSHPTGEVNPLAIELLQKHRIELSTLRSKSWDEFAKSAGPELDFVFTVCDKAAGEACPIWPGQPVTAHWGVRDPAAVTGSDEAKRKAFQVAFTELSTRINLLLALPIERLDRLTLTTKVEEIGKMHVRGQDDLRIDVERDQELQYWSQTLGVSGEQLRNAVAKVGPAVKNVRDHLHRGP